jgi:hypothetical protein
MDALLLERAMRKIAILVAGLALVLAGSLRAEAGTVSLKLHNGLVTIDAKDASIHQIIAEWQKVGRTLFIDADGLAGPPITLQLSDVPERQALDLILKSAAGYMAAPRSMLVPNASVYDRIFVLASSVAPPAPPPGAIRRPPVVLYPQSPNQNPRQIPVFRPRFPARPPANGDQDNDSDDEDDDAAQAPAASPVVTAPAGTSQPGLVIVPQKKKPDGGGQ